MAVNKRYEVIVIGSGPTGESAALTARASGASVAVLERAPRVGGAAVNTGGIPSKSLREAAMYYSAQRTRGQFGAECTFGAGPSMHDLWHRAERAADAQRQTILHTFQTHGVELIQGDAALTGRSDGEGVAVHMRRPDGSEDTLLARRVIVATGSHPGLPAGVRSDGAALFDSDSILSMSSLPTSMLVVGEGFIGMEYASLFAALGVDVTVVAGGDQVLPSMDQEIAETLTRRLRGLGTRLLFGQRVAAAERGPAGAVVRLTSGRALSAEVALFATGRVGNTWGLGLDELGVAQRSDGSIVVDEHFRTTVPGIYAAGDVVGPPALASVGIEQARVAVSHALGQDQPAPFDANVPIAVFTVPEVAMVGATEGDLRRAGHPFAVGRAVYDANARAQTLGADEGLLKILFDPRDGRLLGVHIIGEQASELINLGALWLARDRDGAGAIERIVSTTTNWPSLSALFRHAALDGLASMRRPRRSPRDVAPLPLGAAAGR